MLNQSKVHWETTLRNTLGKNYDMLISHTLQVVHTPHTDTTPPMHNAPLLPA